MLKIATSVIALIVGATAISPAQAPIIDYAGSDYKTAAGAIGPKGIISTTNYELKIKSGKTILLDSAVISGLKVIGNGIIIPTNKQGTIALGVGITTHQRDSVWYNGELLFQGMSAAVQVFRNYDLSKKGDTPAIVLYLRTSVSAHTVVKDKFDEEHSQYNK